MQYNFHIIFLQYDNDLGDQYRSLRQPGNDLYQNITSVRYQRNIRTHAARRAENACKDNLEMDQVSNDYENIWIKTQVNF